MEPKAQENRWFQCHADIQQYVSQKGRHCSGFAAAMPAFRMCFAAVERITGPVDCWHYLAGARGVRGVSGASGRRRALI